MTRSASPSVAARAAAEVSDKDVAALAALTIGQLAQDDETWGEALWHAYDNGKPSTRSWAAFLLGSEIEDDDTAYMLLEEATRSADRTVAADAAEAMAERFAEESAIAERYASMHALLQQPREWR